MRLYVLDERRIWYGPLIQAAIARGYDARRIRRGSEAPGPGFGFIRVHADPEVLKQNYDDDAAMRACLTMVQDRAQVEVYERKSEQFWRWGRFMPRTWRIEDREAALELLRNDHLYETPKVLVSKADVGASSMNVRVLKTRAEQVSHIKHLFGRGVLVNHGAGGPGGRNVTSMQRGYVLLQEFIPHTVTWRVNVIGRRFAIFKRFCYPDRPVAQTGNVEPVMKLDAETESLLEYAGMVAAEIGTRWCALDILKAGDRWQLLETSLAWPWPSPGECMKAPFFGETTRTWEAMWELLLDEIEAGVWGA
jgi:hypothetical protein